LPNYSSFIRLVRIRYLSGLLAFALTSGAIMYALNGVNAFRHDIDVICATPPISPRPPPRHGASKRAMRSNRPLAAMPSA
jgi:hypothetical protein